MNAAQIITTTGQAVRWMNALNTCDDLVQYPVETLNELTVQARSVLRATEATQDMRAARGQAKATRERDLLKGTTCAGARMKDGRMYLV